MAHNKDDKKGKGVEFTAIIALLLVSLLLVSGFLLVGIIESKVEINADEIIISGMYKRIIDRADITEITLEDNIPKVLGKVNGFNLGSNLKGNFKLDGVGLANIYIQENVSPYIVIKTDERLYIINYKDPEMTKKLYETLLK